MEHSDDITVQLKDLLQATAAGDEKAFRGLFELHQKKVYSFAFYLTRSELMAEEMVQEIFLKIWLNRQQLAEIERFDAWLKTLVRNLSYTWLKRIALESQILRDLYSGPEGNRDTEDTLQIREYRKLLYSAINNLPARQKEVYLLSRQQQLTHAQIAEQLQLSLNTVKNHMKAALSGIRKALDGHALELFPSLLLLPSFCENYFQVN